MQLSGLARVEKNEKKNSGDGTDDVYVSSWP
jgi:hypothetical protein